MTVTKQIAGTVLTGPLDTALDHWREGQGCAAWVDSANRRCRKPADKYLCPRHQAVAMRRWEKQAAKDQARQARSAEMRQRLVELFQESEAAK